MFRIRIARSCRLALLVGVALATCGVCTNCSLLGTAASVGMLKLQFGCLVEGTPIDTPKGPVPIERLVAGDVVIGYGGSPVEIRQLHQYKEDSAVARHLAVSFTDGAEIRLSRRHRIGGIPAGDLKEGQTVGDRVVGRIRPLAGVSRSFDLLTEDAGYRIHGIPVNSMIEEMARR